MTGSLHSSNLWHQRSDVQLGVSHLTKNRLLQWFSRSFVGWFDSSCVVEFKSYSEPFHWCSCVWSEGLAFVLMMLISNCYRSKPSAVLWPRSSPHLWRLPHSWTSWLGCELLCDITQKLLILKLPSTCGNHGNSIQHAPTLYGFNGDPVPGV